MDLKIIEHHKFTLGDKYYLFASAELKAYRINKSFYDELCLREFNSNNKEFYHSLDSINMIEKTENTSIRASNSSNITGWNIYSIAINVAQICNMKCIYCYGDGGEYGNKTVMDIETALNSVNFLVENSGNKRKIYICFFGGEPLLNYSLIKKLVKYTKEIEEQTDKKFSYGITTNGTLLNDEINSFLHENKISVTISFDGDKPSQDANRPLNIPKSSYEYILPRIIRYLNLKGDKPTVRVTLTGYSSNLNIIRSNLKRVGFEKMEFIPVSCSTQGDFNTGMEQINDIISDIKNEAEELLQRIKTRKIIYLNSFAEIVLRLILRQKRDYYCGAGRTYAAVSADGKVYPCHRFVGDNNMCLGDIKEINRNKDIDFKVAPVDINKSCRQCWVRNLCGGGCYYDNYVHNGQTYKPDSVFCGIFRKKVEYAVFVIDSLSQEDKDFLKKNMRNKGCS